MPPSLPNPTSRPLPNSVARHPAVGASRHAGAKAAVIDDSAHGAAGLPNLTTYDFGRTMWFGSPALFAGLVRLAETGLLAAIGYIIAAFYVDPEDFRGNTQYIAAPVVTALVASALFHQAGLYSIQSLTRAFKCLPRLLLAWTAAVGGLVACVFFLKIGPEFSRVWLALWHVAGCAMLMAARGSVAASARRALQDGRLVRRAVVYGGGAISERLLRDLAADPASDVRICGIFDDRGDARMTRTVGGIPRLGNSCDLVQFSREKNVDLLIMALPLAAESRLKGLLAKLGVLPVDIRLAGRASELRLRPRAYSYIGSVPFLDLHDKPIAGWSNIAKSVFDKTIAGLAVIALSPVMLAVALAIRLDSKGPVLFRQKRYGFNNELIEVFKFRSMYVSETDAAASRLVTKSDPRVTKVGRFLRKSSLDELPQLFNVLAGTLSLVGPRPHAVQAKAANALYPDVVDGYFGRHKVKPGITGWAQINGWRGETDTEEKIQKRVEYDMDYIENWSLAFDLYILARTPFALLDTKNAY
jgi:Undecaprenyl-phosphate glucose phosphotransferase